MFKHISTCSIFIQVKFIFIQRGKYKFYTLYLLILFKVECNWNSSFFEEKKNQMTQFLKYRNITIYLQEINIENYLCLL